MSAIRNKQRLIHLYRYLLVNTDEEHQVTTNDLVGFLRKEDANASRKTVKDDIEMLSKEGIDIVTTKSYYNAYFVGSRKFEVPEITFLTEGVASSVSLTREQKEKLIEKLLSMLSVHQADKVRKRIIYSGSRGNEQFYYSIDRITDAIDEGKKIGFQYFDGGTADRSPRDSGRNCVITPYALYCESDRFHVIGSEAGKAAAFRLDRITKVRILDEKAEPVPVDFALHTFVRALFGAEQGSLTEVVLECNNRMIGEVVEKFGDNLDLWKSTADSFYVKVPVCVSSAFYAWVFRYGGEIRITSPDSVVRGYSELIRSALRQEKKR